MKKVAIIGASGEIGSRLIEYLGDQYEYFSIVRDKSKRKNLSTTSTVIQVDDITDIQNLSGALAGMDVIINTGYIWFAPYVYDALKKANHKPQHILFTGSTGVFTKIDSGSARQKRDAEAYIKMHYDFPWTIIRPTMIYGHEADRNIYKISKFLRVSPIVPVIGKGNNLIQPVFYKDLLEAFRIALLNESFFNRSFNIGGSEAISNKDLFKEILKVLNKKSWFIHIHPQLIIFLVRILRRLKLNPISEEQVYRFQEDKDVDMSEFVDSFQFMPKSFSEGVKYIVK